MNVIHAEASFILKINIDKIYRSLIVDYLSNPFYYEEREDSGIQSGLSIPGGVFIYTVKSKSDLSYFCSLPIADPSLLKKYITIKLKISELQKDQHGNSFGTSKDGRLRLAFNGQTFAIAFSLNKEYVDDVLIDLLNKTRLLPHTDHKIAELKKMNSHLAYTFSGLNGTGEFIDGMFHFKGDFKFKDLDTQGDVFIHRKFIDNAAIKGWLNAQILTQKPHAEIQIAHHKFNQDSLLKYYNGYFDVELAGLVDQKETVTTYEYNDDFEKKEIKRTQVVKVPRLTATFRTRSESLSNYLIKAGLVGDDAVINKQVFPLYTVWTKTDTDIFILSTDRTCAVPVLSQKSPYFFNLEVNFEKLEVQRHFPWLQRHVKPVNNMWLRASKSGAKHQFELAAVFKMKDINALAQF